MELIDSISVDSNSGTSFIELYHGDLANIPPQHAVDLLIISAFPNSYYPSPNSLIGALDYQGISIAYLARKKAVDLREAFSCWLSEEIKNGKKEHGFRQVLCFEPLVKGHPPEVIGDIFQSLMPFVYSEPPINSIAMPLVTTGDQGVPLKAIIEPLLDAAYHWLSLGMPVQNIKIVENSPTKAANIQHYFELFKQSKEQRDLSRTPDYTYHVFISYSHQNEEITDFIVKELRTQQPEIRIFLDRQDLNPGSSWQAEIFEALDDCQVVLAVYSPHYILSKVCKEEFNIALFRHRESEEGILLPIYIHSAKLPTYMKLVQFFDCRENDREKISEACSQIVTQLGYPRPTS